MTSTLTIDRTQLPGLEAVKVKAKVWELVWRCPLCGEDDVSIPVIDIKGGPTLSACTSCQFGFLSVRPDKAWIDAFYERQWDKDKIGNEAIRPRPNMKAFNMCHRLYSGQGNKVLDIGAGFGGSLLPFKERGWECYALEPSVHRAKVLEAQDITVVQTVEPLEGECDLVIMHHSLEHRYDPRRAVREAKASLKPGGHLFIAVPDMFQEYPLQAAHYVGHLSLFTFYSLITLLVEEGFGLVLGDDSEMDIRLVAQALPEGVSHKDSLPANKGFEDFEAKVEEWVLGSIGKQQGAKTLLWSTANTQQRRYPDWRMKGHMKHPEQVVPRGMGGELRALWVRDAIMGTGLPLQVEHPKRAPKTVWIK